MAVYSRVLCAEEIKELYKTWDYAALFGTGKSTTVSVPALTAPKGAAGLLTTFYAANGLKTQKMFTGTENFGSASPLRRGTD